MRVLVTGSRDWQDWNKVWDVLNRLCAENTILIHGDCPTGADKQADEWAKCQPDIVIERHPADWSRYGKRAGFIRNAEMIKRHPNVVVAFIRNNSKGATMTADLAEKAGIPVVYFREE